MKKNILRKITVVVTAVTVFMGCIFLNFHKCYASTQHQNNDRSGATVFILELPPLNEDAEKDFVKFRDNTIETIRKRLKNWKNLECKIEHAGKNFISICVPAISEDEKRALEALILCNAKLEFRLVHPDNTDYRLLSDIENAHKAYNTKNPKKTLTIENFYAEVYRPTHPELAEYDLLYTVDKGKRYYDLISTKVEMTGSGIKNAVACRNQFGWGEIQIDFNSEAANQFGKITSANIGKRLGIVLNGQLCSAPILCEPILDGRAQITGNFSEDEAKSIAAALISGDISFDIKIVFCMDIAPAAGQNSIQK